MVCGINPQEAVKSGQFAQLQVPSPQSFTHLHLPYPLPLQALTLFKYSVIYLTLNQTNSLSGHVFNHPCPLPLIRGHWVKGISHRSSPDVVKQQHTAPVHSTRLIWKSIHQEFILTEVVHRKHWIIYENYTFFETVTGHFVSHSIKKTTIVDYEILSKGLTYVFQVCVCVTWPLRSHYIDLGL